MDMKQILILGLFLVPVVVSACSEEQRVQCYEEDKLDEKAQKMLRRHYPQHPEVLPTTAPGQRACPTDLYQHYIPSHTSVRKRTLPDHFPSTYYEAECLCDGCILINKPHGAVESYDYNSRPLIQSRVFLRRELCGSGNLYRLQPVNVKVAVGCTCVRPDQ